MPQAEANRVKLSIIVYVLLTFAFSAVFYRLIIHNGSLGAHGGLFVLAASLLACFSKGICEGTAGAGAKRNINSPATGFLSHTPQLSMSRCGFSASRTSTRPASPPLLSGYCITPQEHHPLSSRIFFSSRPSAWPARASRLSAKNSAGADFSFRNWRKSCPLVAWL